MSHYCLILPNLFYRSAPIKWHQLIAILFKCSSPEDIIILSKMMNADGLVVTYYVADNEDAYLITTEDLRNVVLENDEDMSSDFGYKVSLCYNHIAVS